MLNCKWLDFAMQHWKRLDRAGKYGAILCDDGWLYMDVTPSPDDGDKHADVLAFIQSFLDQ